MNNGRSETAHGHKLRRIATTLVPSLPRCNAAWLLGLWLGFFRLNTALAELTSVKLKRTELTPNQTIITVNPLQL